MLAVPGLVLPGNDSDCDSDGTAMATSDDSDAPADDEDVNGCSDAVALRAVESLLLSMGAPGDSSACHRPMSPRLADIVESLGLTEVDSVRSCSEALSMGPGAFGRATASVRNAASHKLQAEQSTAKPAGHQPSSSHAAPHGGIGRGASSSGALCHWHPNGFVCALGDKPQQALLLAGMVPCLRAPWSVLPRWDGCDVSSPLRKAAFLGCSPMFPCGGSLQMVGQALVGLLN